ncbi:MBL fold metallo-hydrolase [Desulfurivibrio sp. D14AmB]|uniref:MBL fold metallo-hydrolase n=1 Tax=Desulfurivibrio sp. D14AmB TaxID=3374370 RepID=UPI00376EF890
MPVAPNKTASSPLGQLLLLIILWSALFAPGGEAAAKTLSYFGQGGQQTVGGSLHVLENSSGLYLIDVGSFVGGDGPNYPWPAEIPVARIRALFITHIHADHIGRLPLLLHQGYRGPIHLSRVSYELARVTLPANLHLIDLGPERFYYSRNNAGRKRIPVYLEGYDFGERAVKPQNRIYFTSHRHRLATQGYHLARPQRQKLEAELLARLDEQAIINDPDQPFTVDEFKARFLTTPHMAGSVMVELEYRGLRILFAGDTGANGSPLLPDNPGFSQPIDLLFLEGTYGRDRELAPAAARADFRRELAARLAEGYRVVIPAFALDRSQQIVQEIGRAAANGQLPPDQVVRVCSSTARALLNRYADFVGRDEFAPYFRPEVDESHFLPPGYRPDCSSDDPDNPLGLQHGEIGVMTSGMADYASARQALLDYLEDPKTLFYFTSYQAPASLGGRLTAGSKPPAELRIGAYRRQVKAKILQTSGFSGHSSPREMIEIFTAAQPRRIYLVHLDRRNATTLANRYRQEFQAEIIIPRQTERHQLYP